MTRRYLAVALVAALTLGACDGGGEDPAPAGDGGAGDADAASDASEEPDEVAGPHGSLRLTGWVERNRNMVSVALRGVEIDDAGHILVDIESVNRGFRGRSAASLAMAGNVRVTDDLGTTYPFQRPADHEDLRFAADERLTATLAFEGPIDPDARYLEVAFNQRDGESIPTAEDAPSQYPKFLFVDVPLPGVGLEDEADRGGSNSLIDTVEVEIGRTAELDWLPDLEVTLLRYRSDGQTIEFDIEASNRTDAAVQLASGHPRLDDGTDSQIVFEPNESDDRDEQVIRLEPGDEATFTVAFRGSISPESEGLRLRLNPNARDRDSTTRPYVEFADLPLPDEGAST